MNQYILLIQGNETSATTDAEWERFFSAARESNTFKGGSEIGRREVFGNPKQSQPTDHIVGYMRFDSDDRQEILDLLKIHPVVLHGGSVELCELPKS